MIYIPDQCNYITLVWSSVRLGSEMSAYKERSEKMNCRIMRIATALTSLCFLSLICFQPGTASAVVSTAYDQGDWQVCWGDLHGHTADSQDAAFPPGDTLNGIKDGPAEALNYAKSGSEGDLDFIALTDHAECFQTIPGWKQKGMIDRYEEMISLCLQYKSSSEIIVFPGFEYTNSELPEDSAGYGHKCVIFKDPSYINDRPIPSPTNTNDNPSAASVKELWAELDSSPAAGNYMTIPHHPAKGMRYENGDYYWMGTDWASQYIDAARMPLVEIYSVHGSSEIKGCEEPVQDFQDSASVEAGLRRWFTSSYNPAYKLGIIASTDNHMAKPGSVAEKEENVHEREGPFTGGLVAAWTKGKNRSNIWSALTGRHVYATSGARIKLEFTASTVSQDETMMGDTLYYDSSQGIPPVTLRIAAESVKDKNGQASGINRIVLYKNTASGTTLVEFRSDEFTDLDDTRGTAAVEYIDTDSASSYRYYRVKVFQNETPLVDSYNPGDEWDEGAHCPNERAWSSPIWLEPKAVSQNNASDEIKIFINGQLLEADVDPAVAGESILVPMRAVFEEIGAEVTWDEASQTATCSKGGTIVALTLNEMTAYVNGEAQQLDVPAQVIGERILAPLRFVSEALGASVEWKDNPPAVYMTVSQ